MNINFDMIYHNHQTRFFISKVCHSKITFSLIYNIMHNTNHRILLSEFISQSIDLSASIAENDNLHSRKNLVQISKSIDFSIFLFDNNVKLFDIFEDKFI